MENKINLNIAFYAREDWERLLSISIDKNKLENSWEKWYENYRKAKIEFLAQVIITYDVRVSLDELIEFCKQRNLKIDGAARSRFVAGKKVNYGL